VLATKANVDPEKVFKAIRGGLAGSTVLDAKAPLVLEGNFKPGFRIDLHIKDLQNAIDTASSVKTPTPISNSVIEMMRALSSDGKGSDDHGGLVQWYEKEAGIKVRK
jgi:2-hydroxy-3-oxopropionate reductase